MPLITDIKSIDINGMCLQSYPCQHPVRVVMNNGESYSGTIGGNKVLCLIIMTKKKSRFNQHFYDSYVREATEILQAKKPIKIADVEFEFPPSFKFKPIKVPKPKVPKSSAAAASGKRTKKGTDMIKQMERAGLNWGWRGNESDAEILAIQRTVFPETNWN